MRLLQKVWKDDAGFVVSTELILVATILVIGMIVGLMTVRNAVVQELGDVAMAIGSTNQSYEYTSVTGRELADNGEYSSYTAGSVFEDKLDFCDGATGRDVAGGEPAGINVQQDAAREGT